MELVGEGVAFRLEYDALGFIDELVVDGAGEAIGEAYRGTKPVVATLTEVPAGVLAEFLHQAGAGGNQCHTDWFEKWGMNQAGSP